jgi:hypothetical protein
MKNRWNAAVALATLMLAVQSPLAAQNIAEGQLTGQSSTYPLGESWRAVDGNRNGNWTGDATNSIAHTNFDQNAWWYVDLGSFFDITRIDIWNRTDCCSDRLFPFRVVIQDVFNAALTSGNDLWSADMAVPAGSPLIFNPGGVSGRFVKVQLLRAEYLQLAEVEVLGTPTGSAVVPEPLSMLLLGTGLAGVAAVGRRRRGQRARA